MGKQDKWKESLMRFREILVATELTETIKWGVPVYTLNGKHVAGIGAFKSYVGIWFFQGAFLKDPHKKLVNAQKGKEIKPYKKKPLIIPDELNAKIEMDQELKTGFDELSLSKQREYAEYISETKREETKLKRLEKIIPMIKEKIGLSDKYR